MKNIKKAVAPKLPATIAAAKAASAKARDEAEAMLLEKQLKASLTEAPAIPAASSRTSKHKMLDLLAKAEGALIRINGLLGAERSIGFALESFADAIASLPANYKAPPQSRAPRAPIEEGATYQLREKWASLYAAFAKSGELPDLKVKVVRVVNDTTFLAKLSDGTQVPMQRAHVKGVK